MGIGDVLLRLRRFFLVVSAEPPAKSAERRIGCRRDNAFEIADVRRSDDIAVGDGFPVVSFESENEPAAEYFARRILYGGNDVGRRDFNRRIDDFLHLFSRR